MREEVKFSLRSILTKKLFISNRILRIQKKYTKEEEV